MMPLSACDHRRITLNRFSLRAIVHPLLVLCAIYCTFPTVALAADEPTNGVLAQRLFEEGRLLMKAKRYDLACAKLAESQALDPGTGTLLNLGICRQREGRTATAFALLTEALEQATRTAHRGRVKTARRHLGQLAEVLSHVTVRVTDPVQAEQIVVAIDGATIAPVSLGQAIPMDPGAHEIVVSLPGHVSWSTRIDLKPDADTQTITVPRLNLVPEVAKPEPARAPAPAPTPAPAPHRRVDPPPPTPHLRTTRHTPWTGYALTGGGVAALGLGTFFGIRALTLRARSDRNFDGKFCTKQGCVDDWNDAKTSAALSDVSLGVGAVAVGVGAYLLLRPDPKDQRGDRLSLSLNVNTTGGIAAVRTQF